MTRKDYVVIAMGIRRAITNADMHGHGTEEIRLTADYIADELEIDNPRFDRERFLAAALGETN